MNVRPPRVVLALLALATLALPLGCLAPNTRDDAGAEPRAELDRYRLTSGEARSLAGCRYGYRVYEPLVDVATGAGERPSSAVVLGHGFLRDQDTLVGLARALANAGFPVATLDFCNMRPWNGHHERNARDLVALARRLDADGIVYAGFSAGALAAVLAAARAEAARTDPSVTGGIGTESEVGDALPVTLGVVTLDLVDQADLAVNALRSLDVPLIGLQGPPSACNANGSGQRVFDTRPAASLETLPGASHCEFESPTGFLCESACGDDDDDADDERVRTDVIRRVVAAVGRLRGDDGTPRVPEGGSDTVVPPEANLRAPTPSSVAVLP